MNQRSGSSSTRRWWLVVVVGALTLTSGGWLLSGAAAGPTLTADQLFQRVLGAVTTYYVDSLPADSLMHKATRGMLDELGDPYSTLLEGKDYSELTEATTGNYGGLGIQIDVRDGWITVVAPLPDTPAERLGIEAGDQIVAVEGKSTQNLNQDDAVKTLRGAPGSTIDIQIRRPGYPALLPFSVTRETIHNRSVQRGTLVGDGVGIVQLRPVSETSAKELKEEVNRLRKNGMTSLILDLRGNPGGLLDQGVAVSDLFLEKGSQIVSTRGRAEGTSRSFAAEKGQEWADMPVVVLVNQWTASAAEIIAGALQDNDRAAVVGTPTFGKGLVQSLFNLGDGTALKLTTARWYTPSGRSIQRTSKNQEDQIAEVEAIANGGDTTSVDSLPTHKTIGGRLVRGGGGIVPDELVRLDTLSAGERVFFGALGGNIAAYRDALLVAALDAKEHNRVTKEDFTVTDQMRDKVFEKLAEDDIHMTPEEQQGGLGFLNDQLGYEVARYIFGREAELRREAQDDAQVRKAIELLANATTPQALMNLLGGP